MDVQQWGFEANGDDHLTMSGCDVVRLADELGTPLHVVDGAHLRRTVRRFTRAFAQQLPHVEVFSSYKTNPIPGILALLHQEGCGAEVISPYELWLAARLGVSGSAMVYNGPNKAVRDLREALRLGVGLINVDSEAELDRLIEVARALRVHPRVGIRIKDPGGWGPQFGEAATASEIARLVHKGDASGVLDLCCLHVHGGSGLRHPAAKVRAIRATMELQAELKRRLGRAMPMVDLGGGFGVPTVKTLALWETALYRLLGRPPRAPDPDACATPERFGEAMGQALMACCERYDLEPPRILLEPGRALTSGAQVLLVRVGDLKVNGGRRFALTDGGMQNIGFPLSYEYHHCVVANRVHAHPDARYTVVGPLCSPEDILYRRWPLPTLRIGDVLAVMDAGAYFISLGNSFSYPRPPVALVEEGRVQVARARETFESLVALDDLAGERQHTPDDGQPASRL